MPYLQIRRCRARDIIGQIAILLLILSMGNSAGDAVAQKPGASPLTIRKCWQYDLNGTRPLSAVAKSDNLYIAEDGGRLTAISLVGGRRLWSTELGGDVQSNLALSGSNIYVVSTSAAEKARVRLRSLSIATGLTNREIELPAGQNVWLGSDAGKVIAAMGNGQLIAFDTNSGNQLWEKQFPPIESGTLALKNDELAFATSDRKVHVLSAAAGSEKATVKSDFPVSALAIYNDDILWGDERGSIVRYDLKKGRALWRLKNGARISGLQITGSGVIATSFDNFVYLIQPSTGNVRWKRRLAGRVADAPLVNGGIAIILTVGGQEAVYMRLEDGKPVGQMSVGDDEAFMGPPILAAGAFAFLMNNRVTLQTSGSCPAK